MNKDVSHVTDIEKKEQMMKRTVTTLTSYY